MSRTIAAIRPASERPNLGERASYAKSLCRQHAQDDERHQHDHCATANGGSVPSGAIACKGGIFKNDCTTSTKTLKYNAIIAEITYVARQPPAIGEGYRAYTATPSAMQRENRQRVRGHEVIDRKTETGHARRRSW